MATRKIIDAKQDGEKVWVKGHAKAIYMSNGSTVEDAIYNIETGGSNINLSDYATKEELNNKQENLVSGTNIKTINGQSLLGSGDITISGGSSSSESRAYSEVNHGTSDTTFTLTPNTFHVWDTVTTLDLSFGEETSGVANEFLFQFTSGATATTLTLPDSIKWANDSAPTIEANKIYQVSVLKGLGSIMTFSNT